MSEIKPTITCDGCGTDITSTGNCEDWRLRLGVEPKSSLGGAVTAMHIPRPIDDTKHFCGLRCLRAWLAADG